MTNKKLTIQYTAENGNAPSDNISVPKYEGDAGFDLASSEDVHIGPHQLVNVPIGINIELPLGVVALVVGRSSMTFQGMQCMGTIIDTGYRGPLFVAVYNLLHLEAKIPKGTRVAQLVLLENLGAECDVLQVKELSQSERGPRGFGSTGAAIEPRRTLPVSSPDGK